MFAVSKIAASACCCEMWYLLLSLSIRLYTSRCTDLGPLQQILDHYRCVVNDVTYHLCRVLLNSLPQHIHTSSSLQMSILPLEVGIEDHQGHHPWRHLIRMVHVWIRCIHYEINCPRLLSFLTFLPLNAYKCGTIPSWWIPNLQFMEQSIFFTHTVPQRFLLLQLLFINLSEVWHHINGQEKNVVMVPVSFVFLTIEIVLQMYVLRPEVLNNNHNRP